MNPANSFDLSKPLIMRSLRASNLPDFLDRRECAINTFYCHAVHFSTPYENNQVLRHITHANYWVWIRLLLQIHIFNVPIFYFSTFFVSF